jgi:hypothetical protein
LISLLWQIGIINTLNINLLLQEHIVKNGRFSLKAFCNKFKLLWNYKNCFNTDQTLNKSELEQSLCNIMLNLKFTVTLAIWGHLKIAKITILS